MFLSYISEQKNRTPCLRYDCRNRCVRRETRDGGSKIGKQVIITSFKVLCLRVVQQMKLGSYV